MSWARLSNFNQRTSLVEIRLHTENQVPWKWSKSLCGVGGGVGYGPITFSIQLELSWVELDCDNNIKKTKLCIPQNS